MIRGIVAAVPRNVVRNEDVKFIAATGVAERRIARPRQDAADLGYEAAWHLLDKMNWQVTDVSALICVTQTPAHRMPSNAFLIAGGLPLSCPAFDVNLACSGYVYGLWLASKIGGRVLLIAGDTVSRMCEGSEPGTRNLFGDCVTATACETGPLMTGGFILGTDGSGYADLIADPHIRMNGPEVFNFCNRAVPPLVEHVTMNANVDWYLFHQANATILNHLAKKCAIRPERAPQNIQRYGNTSSASIPLLMCDSSCTLALKANRNRVAMFGFGAGFSYGGCMLDLDPLQVCEVIEC